MRVEKWLFTRRYVGVVLSGNWKRGSYLAIGVGSKDAAKQAVGA